MFSAHADSVEAFQRQIEPLRYVSTKNERDRAGGKAGQQQSNSHQRVKETNGAKIQDQLHRVSENIHNMLDHLSIDDKLRGCG